jgi:hypothetical protein
MADYILTEAGQFVVAPKKIRKAPQVTAPAKALVIDADEIPESLTPEVHAIIGLIKLNGSETNKELKMFLDDREVKYSKQANKVKLLELLAPYLINVAVDEEIDL